jgi:hypothetical protein
MRSPQILETHVSNGILPFYCLLLVCLVALLSLKHRVTPPLSAERGGERSKSRIHTASGHPPPAAHASALRLDFYQSCLRSQTSTTGVQPILERQTPGGVIRRIWLRIWLRISGCYNYFGVFGSSVFRAILDQFFGFLSGFTCTLKQFRTPGGENAIAHQPLIFFITTR